MTEKRADRSLAIIGAGIVGLCSALEAAEAGFDVTVIDRLRPGEGASYGIAGVVSPWSVVPQAMPGIWKNVPKWLLDPAGPVKIHWRDLPRILQWVRSFFAHATEDEVIRISDAMAWLMQDNIELYSNYLMGTGEQQLIQASNMLTVYRGNKRPDLGDLTSRLRLRQGAKLHVLSGEEIREIEPALSTEFNHAIMVESQSRVMDPGKVCKVLAKKARTMNVRFLQNEVQELTPHSEGGYTLKYNGGEIFSQRLLICAGAWSMQLLKPLGVKLPLIGERGYHLVFTDPGIRLKNSIADADAKVILNHMDAGVRIAGTAEFGHPDAPPNYKRAKALEPIARRLFPDLNTHPKQQWMGVRPSFPDNLPVIDQVRGFKNLFVAFGHSHYGFGMAPQTAKLIRSLLTGAKPNFDYSAVSSSRFS